MQVCLVTGAAGLIGAEASRFFSAKGYRILGIDNNLRKEFFGQAACTDWRRQELETALPNYSHYAVDIRDRRRIEALFAEFGADIAVVVHAAAQPSHDWAAANPHADFGVNALGTLTLLEATRQFSPEACFLFTSTNKVYGDNPNLLPLVELETRWEVDPSHPYYAHGIDEQLSVDQTKHSLFGVSKLAADAMVQEYGRYFGMKTVCFRGGCLTGPHHSGAELHGFLAYIARAIRERRTYRIFGYKGKQVRDNIHSYDVCTAIMAFQERPVPGAVYNLGGGRANSISVLEAIHRLEELLSRKLEREYVEEARLGDHICYISDLGRFRSDFPEWEVTISLEQILSQLAEAEVPAVS